MASTEEGKVQESAPPRESLVIFLLHILQLGFWVLHHFKRPDFMA